MPARVPRRTLVLGLLALVVLGTVASTAAPTFDSALAARFLAGLPPGAYWVIAVMCDRDLRRAMLAGFVGILAAVAFFGLFAGTAPGLFAGAFLIGATSLFLGPALQARLIAVAPGAQLMGAAVNQSAMNVADSLGAALGGATIPDGYAPMSGTPHP